MKLPRTFVTFAVAAALATGAAAAPALTESDVRALLTAHGYSKIDDVENAGTVWKAKATTSVGNEFDLRVDARTRAINIDYEGDDSIANAPANGLSKDTITRRLQAAGYRNIVGVELDNDHWTAQVLDPDNTTVVLELDPYDGHVITRRN